MESRHKSNMIESQHKSNVTGFPFKNTFTPKEKIMDRFERLKEVEPKLIVSSTSNYRILNFNDCPPGWLRFYGLDIVNAANNKYIKKASRTVFGDGGVSALLADKNGTWELYDDITDFYQEAVRLSWKRIDQKESVLEYYKNEYNTIAKQCERKYGKIEPEYMRDTIYQMTFECNNFKPSLLVGLIKILREGGYVVNSMLDMSMGLGDRLVAALASDINIYVGVDPNISLHFGYNSILEDFGAENHKNNYRFIIDCFEKCDLAGIPNGGVDLAFSSCPFFNAEEYVSIAANGITEEQAAAHTSMQSHNMYTCIETWFNKFLMPSMKKNIDNLRIGGLLVMSINDSRDNNFLANMINGICSYDNVEFLGCISYYNEFRVKTNKNYGTGKIPAKPVTFVDGGKFPQPISPQPFWIWKRIK